MLRVILTILLLVSPSLSQSVEPVCSSLCDITHATEDGCFQSTIAFFENSLVESLRNYVDVQTRLQRIRSMYGEPLLTNDEMIDRSINNMDKAPFRILEDEVFDLDRARDVLGHLANNIESIASDAVLPAVECPQGCEKSSTLWMGLFLASLTVNCVIAAIAVAAVLYITSRNEKKARLLLTKSLEREKKKLTEKGRQAIVRENSFDHDDSSLKKPTLDPKKWESHSSNGAVNDAYEKDHF